MNKVEPLSKDKSRDNPEPEEREKDEPYTGCYHIATGGIYRELNVYIYSEIWSPRDVLWIMFEEIKSRSRDRHPKGGDR